jgi:hypothetical protein
VSTAFADWLYFKVLRRKVRPFTRAELKRSGFTVQNVGINREGTFQTLKIGKPSMIQTPFQQFK